MLSSSCAVVLYLWRHMKNMEDSGLISPSLQRRIKMTITGITMQVLLHFLCSDGLIIFQIITQYSDVDVDWNGNILCTIISLYSFGTTVNMMVGQSLFRQRAVHAWRNVNSSHWLNVFYCFQILPVQRPSFIWLKRNIRIFMYSALVFSVVVCLLGMSVNTAGIFILYENTTENQTDWTGLDNAWSAGFWMTLGLFCLSLCVMLVSICATLVFLWRHMKNIEKSSSPVSSPRHQRQIRVTIISIAVQAVLHIICSALVVLDEIIIDISPWYFDMKNNILCTIVSLYSLGTTGNMGVSQSLFRQRAVHVWHKLFKPHSLPVSTIARTVSSDILSN
uniref:Taste receptor type 2 n=1 Tax=Pygocentrus nattereri TaxID=42514 RepID=A0AAR2JLP8_PYGNA